MSKIFRFLLVLLFITNSTFAAGLDLVEYYGSRYIGLGGNHPMIGGDAYGPFYNPATMTSVNGTMVSLDSSNLIHIYEAPIGANGAQQKSEIDYGPLFYVGAVHRLTDRISLGLAVFPTALSGGK